MSAPKQHESDTASRSTAGSNQSKENSREPEAEPEDSGPDRLPAATRIDLPASSLSCNSAAFDILAKRQSWSDAAVEETLSGSDFSVQASSANQRLLFEALNQGRPFHYDLSSTRPAQFALSRSELPILACEAEFIHLFRHHLVLLVVGPTGSGKTTQVPQFLLEMGYGIVDDHSARGPVAQSDKPTPPGGRVAITQPRRLAAISTATRVQREIGEREAHRVSYQVRYESTVSAATGLHFMTDGILLRYIAQDFLLSDYSVVVLDEAHERNMNTDILVGLLTRIAQLRASLYLAAKEKEKALLPLRLVVMSATLNVADFTENQRLFPPGSLLSPPPLLSIPGRQWPVTIRYAKRTPTSTEQCLYQAARLVRRIHQRTPQDSGAILVFVAGQSDVWSLIRRIKAGQREAAVDEDANRGENENQSENESENEERIMNQDGAKRPYSKADLEADASSGKMDAVALKRHATFSLDLDDVESQNVQEQNHEAVDIKANGAASDSDLDSDSDSNSGSDSGSIVSDSGSDLSIAVAPLDDLLLMPLYANLPVPRQLLVFEEASKRVTRARKGATEDAAHASRAATSALPRLCIIATNVAETSITIPGVRYVIDSGKVKERTLVPHRHSAASPPAAPTTASPSDSITCSSLSLTWTSRASADQRAGRAGRTGPGCCWRLYSAAVYHELFDEYNTPEIHRMALHSLVLYMKRMNIVHVQGFPFPTPPPAARLAEAEKLLVELGALAVQDTVFSSTLTELGRQMSMFPIDPRQASMLLAAAQHVTLFPYMVRLVAGLAIGDPFDVSSHQEAPDSDKDGSRVATHSDLGSSDSDLIRLLRAVCGYEYEATEERRQLFCQRHGLRPALMKEILLMRDQLYFLFRQHFQVPSSRPALWTAAEQGGAARLRPLPREENAKLVQLFLLGHSRNVAKRQDATKLKWTGKPGQAYLTSQGEAFVDRHSGLAQERHAVWLVYERLERNQQGFLLMKNCSKIEPGWIRL